MHFKKDADQLEQAQKRAIRAIGSLETKPFEERLKDLCLFRLEKRRLRENVRALLKCLKDCHTEEGQDLLLIIP